MKGTHNNTRINSNVTQEIKQRGKKKKKVIKILTYLHDS